MGGKVIAVLPVDLARDEIVLIRQFRLPAYLGNGKGDMVEIVAGRVEPDEALAIAARRECEEEIGVAPSRLVELFTVFSSPGFTDEVITFFLASVDAAKVPAHTVTSDEHIRTLRVPIDAALAALSRNTIRNGPAIIALQWLALNRKRLTELLRS
jgi:ADP-ribose pyrophosphatase